MDEFQAGWHYWRNVAINVVGFIPLVLFQAYFSAVGKIKRATRSPLCWDSSSASRSKCCSISSDQIGVTDLITNTFGRPRSDFMRLSIKHNWFANRSSSVHPWIILDCE